MYGADFVVMSVAAAHPFIHDTQASCILKVAQLLWRVGDWLQIGRGIACSGAI
jgi:hypothetical protein